MAVRTTTSAIETISFAGRMVDSLGILTGIFLLAMEKSLDLLAYLTLGNLDIVLGLAIIGHQGEESIIGDVKLFKID